MGKDRYTYQVCEDEGHILQPWTPKQDYYGDGALDNVRWCTRCNKWIGTGEGNGNDKGRLPASSESSS